MSKNLMTLFTILIILSVSIAICSGSCIFNGRNYMDGDIWNSTCSICQCQSKIVSCTKIACPVLDCLETELPHGSCCPVCEHEKRSCYDDPITYAHNDLWRESSDCILHQCQDGTIVPYVIQCLPHVCPKGEKLSSIPGKCCPECTPNCSVTRSKLETAVADECHHKVNVSKDCVSVPGSKEKLSYITKDSCTLCINDAGKENCYTPKCPLCTRDASSQGHACCSCPKSSCASGCGECLISNPDYCLDCDDLSQVIHEGKCIAKCPDGYYSNENNHCENCSTSCLACFGNMTSQCSACKSGYLLQKGRCVKNCDTNFYISGKYCLECHESCLTCQGPKASDCLSCSLQGQLLQDGNCVDKCIGHFYVLDSTCLECNESCSKCLKDGSCQYCEDNLYLEEEVCVEDCTGGYYKFIDAYCLPCNDECQTCFGPLPFQCTSCPFGQFLLENSCVWDCGQGYFGDLGAGICGTCHPDCRTCLGGSAKDKCLACSSGYLLPYIGTHFGPCIESCPKGYFLTDTGLCALCYETCETCFGPNETDCTSCVESLFFKDGKCVPHCSNGYFHDSEVCYGCHPSCATCYGFNIDECFTCPFGRTFKFEKCVPTCERGKYMDLEGLCNDCHSSCADCMLNSTEGDGIQCLECKNQQEFILYGRCVSECPSNFYLNSYRICQECHSTCATCEKQGATACVSCWNGNFLTHLGTCEAHCHYGYFPSDGVCQACHPNCHSCVSKTECLQCKGDLVLQFGECNPQCSDQHYVDGVSRQCTECSLECNTCRGPSDTDCTSCLPGKLFQDGSCVQNCSEGFFLKRNTCEPCDLKCKTCSILNKCTSCEDPLLLRDGECVDDCGNSQYAHFEELQCKSCGLGCGYCLSSEKCDLCNSGFYLFESACHKQCPDTFYGDPISRICKKNLGAPSIGIDRNLMFQVGQSLLISPSLLNVSDEDADGKLLIMLYDLPTNIKIIKMSDIGKKVEMDVGNNFTTRQLEDGWVFFKHSEQKSPQGELVLKISDGHLSSEEINLPLQIASKYPPQIEQANYVVVPEDTLFVINSSIIHLEDKDNVEDVSLNFVQGPCSGKLLLLPEEKEISSVTYEEFNQNMVAFKSFKTDAVLEDNFIIQAFDGFNSHVADLKVIVLPKTKEDLVVIHNKPFYMNFGITSTLTNGFLLTVGKNVMPEDIQYTIDRAKNPFIGNVFKKTKDFKVLSEITERQIAFTQDDINNYLISYNHPVNSTITVIKMMVANKKKNFEMELDFRIHELNHSLEAPLETNQFGMMVLQNHPAAITNDHLLVQMNGVSSNDIVYMITKKLLKEEGVLENLDHPGVKLQSFTQNEINSLKIVYHPPPYGGSSERQFLFQFVVIEAKSGSQLSPVQNFTITVTPPNSDFTSPASSIDHEATILVTQGQSVELGYNWLSTVGHEIPDDQLEVELTNAPQHGTLVQINGDARTEIYEGDGFSFTSILNGMRYEHDGTNSLHDSAIFSIMGGRHSSLNRVKFEISPNDRESPVILDSTTLMGFVTEGEFLTLQRYHLAFTDLISGDAEIVFSLLSMPKYGVLEKLENGIYNLLKPKDQFTQQDINDKLIRYSANNSIGDDTVRDFLYFDVADASGNVQSNQVLTMKVKPKIKEPPVLKIVSDIQVNEGGEAVIQPNILTVFDPDTPLSELTVIIDKQPDYGFIENSRPIPGAENSLSGLPISSFPYKDLIEGYIKYMQAGHQGVEPEQDTVYINIQDGRLSSATHRVNITIRPVNDETPHVFTDVLLVNIGSYSKILNSTLSVIDADTKPEHIIITFGSLPQKGILKKLVNPLNFKASQTVSNEDSVSFQDVLDGLLLYLHGNVKSSDNDTFNVVISDGHHSVLGTIDVVIIVVDKEVPFLLRNLGLEILPGNSSIITNSTLYASDADSQDNLLIYSLTSDPTAGQLLLFQNGKFQPLSHHNPVLNSFTQNDINRFSLMYQHNLGEATGIHFFKFNVSDPANNTLLDQAFYITISEDIFPPMITRNAGLKVMRNDHECITSEMLSAFDEQQKNLDLIFTITSPTTFGHLELRRNQGSPISEFQMSDLKSKGVCYFHTSASAVSLDSFTFTVSDGKNSVLQTFYINITSIYDYLPTIKISPLVLKEGTRKTITELELDISDKDTNDAGIKIKIITPPSHGSLQYSNNLPVELFTMKDIKTNEIYYSHDDSESLDDSFSMTISDGSHMKFILINDKENITTEGPIKFPVRIIKVDDLFPKLIKNKGIRGLKLHHGQKMNTLSKEILYIEDLDTEDQDILYSVTLQPSIGFLQLSTSIGQKIANFTQKDLIDGKIQYILKKDDSISTVDKFIFSFEDSKPNKIFNNIFEIKWTRFSLNSSFYNATESSGIIEIPVIRTGALDEKDIASCKLVDMKPNILKKRIDLMTNEVLFDANDTLKTCIFKINDNFEFDGKTQFQVLLQSDSLLGHPHVAFLDINDEEDEPVISFTETTFKVNETGKYFHFPIVRKGDLRHEISVMCTTENITAQGSSILGLETGSDYISRGSQSKSFVTFPTGVSETMCSIKIVDDNLYELDESFNLILSNPHPFGKLQGNTTATIIINGPNDVPQISLKSDYSNIPSNQRNLSVTVNREGGDPSKECIVKCGARTSTNSEERLISVHEISIAPFSTSAECNLSFESEIFEQEEINVFLDTPTGCALSEPNSMTFSVIKAKINPLVEFSLTHITVQESSKSIQIPILRTDNLSQNSTVYCVTHDDTAISREDFEERYITRKTSIIIFSPEQKESACVLKIYDDDIYESSESFKVELLAHKIDTETQIGEKKIATVEIIDPEDVTTVQLEKDEYIVPQHMFPNNISTSVTIPVLRHRDARMVSKVRVSTIEGSATSGLDYYAKSKLITFPPGERKMNFEIEILYNKRRNWALSFTVILGPDDVLNANIGNISKAVIRIASVLNTESMILPSVPIVISLLHFDNVSKGMMENPKPGYPLICITPCDPNYPEYASTERLCKDSGIDASSMKYLWEIAMPLNQERMSPFETVTYSTLFTSTQNKILDSIYFRPQERIRCAVQPRDAKGHFGIPLQSKVVKISSEIGFCHSTIRSIHSTLSLQSQPFIATLNYINSSDLQHPNKLHIHIEIPHEDGLLPLISTYPLHNVEFLLTQNIYRQQHVCSNLQSMLTESEKNHSFLKSFNPTKTDINLAFPYHGEQCEKDSLLLYQHLDLKKCKWSFDAWYSMTELVEFCGGTVTSDFKARDTAQTYSTVLLSLYVTYAFAAAPTGWTSVEHRTELEFSFYYDTFLWKSESHADTSLNATIAIVRVGTNPDGHMFFEFKTVAKFYGCFVLDHHTLPGIVSYVSAPENLDINFDLKLLWSEQTFDGPMQFWRATSNYNLKDYTGYYTLHLIPCKVTTSGPQATYYGYKYLPCIAQIPEKFGLPLAYQQTNRPLPVTYALETFFQIFNAKNIFLMNPFENSPNFQYVEYKGEFSKGENIYGRVFWSPKQGLESAYKLNINEIILCAGQNGFMPVYDPTGTIYGKGPQYGCLLPNKNLKYKFVLLDAHDPDSVTKEVQGVPFNARFAQDVPDFVSLSELQGVDGFVFSIDPLFEISSSQQWFLQVIYHIKPTKNRFQRSVDDHNSLPVQNEKGSNIRRIFITQSESKNQDPLTMPALEQHPTLYVYFGMHHLLYILSGMLIVLGIMIIRSKVNFKKLLTISNVHRKSYAFTAFFESMRNSQQMEICEVQRKQKEVFKVKVYSPKTKLYAIDDSLGTEV